MVQINAAELNYIVNNLAIQADKACDYIPFISTATTIINIFQKCVVLPLMNLCHIEKGNYYEYLDNKSFTRCFWLLIPGIGNVISRVLEKMDAYVPNPHTLADDHHALGNSFTITLLHTIGILSDVDVGLAPYKPRGK